MSKSQLHRCLISVRAFSTEGLQLLKLLIKSLCDNIEIESISSVYRIRSEGYQPQHIHDLKNWVTFEGLTLAIRAQTQLGPSDLVRVLFEQERIYRSKMMRRSLSLTLLAYDDYTMMTPHLTLPHPDLHLKPEHLFPSSEVWGDYRHPVIGENLLQLTQGFSEKNWGEFCAQGKSLLDF